MAAVFTADYDGLYSTARKAAAIVCDSAQQNQESHRKVNQQRQMDGENKEFRPDCSPFRRFFFTKARSVLPSRRQRVMNDLDMEPLAEACAAGGCVKNTSKLTLCGVGSTGTWSMDAGTMNISDKSRYLPNLGGSFTEDAPRPPVPGEEGELVCSDGHQHGSFSSKSESLKCEASGATPRRPDLDLGYEPEGSASPTPPYLKWAESLHSLLDDEDGISLFRTFLKREECADMLDFWFACSGFRKPKANEGNGEKTAKLAKVIYKKYILDNNGIVSRQIKPATKSFIKDCVMKHHIDPAMFDQAQTEIQTMMEENTYPLFLKSDIYLEYTRTEGESPKSYSDQSPVSGSGKGRRDNLLNPDSEGWRCDPGPEERPEFDPPPSGGLTQKQSADEESQRAVNTARSQDGDKFRHALHPPHINPDHVLAPATSANDSEQQSMSSDGDTRSLTDSSVDGVPPYRYRRQHRREMHESAKANGRVPLPHIPPPNRAPKDIHVEPERFAAELIRRLEAVVREREAQEKLEERLKRVRLEEEGEEVIMSTAMSLSSHRFPPGAYSQNYSSRYADFAYSAPFFRDAHEENPESILDDHVQRVMKTPGCQSPGTGRHSPKSRSPDGFSGVRGAGPPGQGKHQSRHGFKCEGSHLYHHKHTHHFHHSGASRPKEQVEAEAAVCVYPWNVEMSHYGSKSRSYADGMGSNPMEYGYGSKSVSQGKRVFKKGEEVRPYDMPGSVEEMEKNQKILLWLMEGQKEMVQHKRSPYGSVSGSKRTTGHDGSRLSSADRSGFMHPCIGGPLRNSVQPSHPFIQDPTMPPNPAPSPLIQLEEVCRRLEEEKIKTGTLQPKQRYVMEVIQRGRAAVRPAQFPPLSVVPAVSDGEFSEPEHKASRKQPCESTTVAYYFCEELIPYRTTVRGRVVTLGQFKELLTKKGNYRYYFKKVSDEFDCGVVFEEIREDDAVLPIFEEKIIGKVEKVD